MVFLYKDEKGEDAECSLPQMVTRLIGLHLAYTFAATVTSQIPTAQWPLDSILERSLRIATNDQTADINSPRNNGCFGWCALWLYILLRSTPSPNSALARFHPQISRKFPPWNW